MTIAFQKNDSALTISLSGRLDSASAPEFEKALEENVAGITDLTIDLEGLVYTSSAGLRVFLKAQKMMNRQGKLKLQHVCADIMDIFEITGFTDILTIE